MYNRLVVHYVNRKILQFYEKYFFKFYHLKAFENKQFCKFKQTKPDFFEVCQTSWLLWLFYKTPIFSWLFLVFGPCGNPATGCSLLIPDLKYYYHNLVKTKKKDAYLLVMTFVNWEILNFGKPALSIVIIRFILSLIDLSAWVIKTNSSYMA